MSDSTTVRLVDFDGYESMIDDTTQAYDDDRTYFVVGTHAPERDFSEMLTEYLELAFGSRTPHDLLERARNGLEDTDLETPSHYHDDPEIDDDGLVKRLGDVAYPVASFDDDVDSDVFPGVDTTLLGTIMLPEHAVDPAHPNVFSPAEYIDVFRDVVDEYDPGEHVVYTGAFAPAGSWSIKADHGVFRVGDSLYNADAFANSTGTSSVNKAQTMFYGTTVVPRTLMSKEALEVVDGERDEVVSHRDDDQEAAGEA